jgi:hypothetical protein
MIFAKNKAKKIQSPEVGGKIQSVSRIKLSFGGYQKTYNNNFYLEQGRAQY